MSLVSDVANIIGNPPLGCEWLGYVVCSILLIFAIRVSYEVIYCVLSFIKPRGGRW